ncbi:MAG: IMP dehydrogenase [Sphingobacteriales bacterium]|jgi:IMP dehydrogenase|nr:MAG: IMP dehydrogenase [Sphingobacteriales bacterium]
MENISHLSNSQKFAGDGLTFDDVLLIPAYSQVLPRETNLTSFVTKNISINIPILSAAMDTVTEANLAIALAREGGIGVLHKNMSIEQQANQVRKVKRSESGLISDPITLKPENKVAEAFSIMSENKIGGIPITDDNGILVGIITNRDLRFCKDKNMLIKDLMTKEKLITAPEKTTLKQAEDILHEYRIEKLPIVASNNKLVGLITYKDIIKVRNYPNSCKDDGGRLRVAAAVGVTSDMMNRIDALVNVGVDFISIDTAHGHSQGVIDAVKNVKQTYKNLDVVAGNIATANAAKALADAGADAVKVGIGPGSICTTRIVAGVGVPQLSAIYEASIALKNTNIPIIADGGIRYTGDMVKAIAAGASTIMAGSLFAGTEESPGNTVILEGRKFKVYRGMGSLEAMNEGSKDRYFQDVEEDIKKLVPEGIVGRIPYKGTLSEVVYQYIGGLKAGMGYCGARDIRTLQETAQFVKITAAGVTESHPHDVAITNEAPNYSR